MTFFSTEILEVTRADGLKRMREDGWPKAIQGVTTVDEIARVTKVDVSALSLWTAHPKPPRRVNPYQASRGLEARAVLRSGGDVVAYCIAGF